MKRNEPSCKLENTSLTALESVPGIDTLAESDVSDVEPSVETGNRSTVSGYGGPCEMYSSPGECEPLLVSVIVCLCGGEICYGVSLD